MILCGDNFKQACLTHPIPAVSAKSPYSHHYYAHFIHF